MTPSLNIFQTDFYQVQDQWVWLEIHEMKFWFKPPPSPLCLASKARLGNKARKAISPLASSKYRKCVRGTVPLSQQMQASGYNNKLICVSVAGKFKEESDSSGKTCDDRLRMRKALLSRNALGRLCQGHVSTVHSHFCL